jgi:hypothetical protein
MDSLYKGGSTIEKIVFNSDYMGKSLKIFVRTAELEKFILKLPDIVSI